MRGGLSLVRMYLKVWGSQPVGSVSFRYSLQASFHSNRKCVYYCLVSSTAWIGEEACCWDRINIQHSSFNSTNPRFIVDGISFNVTKRIKQCRKVFYLECIGRVYHEYLLSLELSMLGSGI